MHVPDGFIDAPVSVATGVVAAAAVAVSLRGARRELGEAGGPGGAGDSVGPDGERTAPLAGLVAAFIFAVQMLNFPVAAGTSGHLLGGALAAILVGPYTGVLCVSVVLLMQGVLFADGGLTALGVNITDMAVVTTVVAYAVFRAVLKLAPRRRRSVTVASFVAALVSVPAAAVAFTAIYALGGTTHVSLGKVFTAMVGVHVLIGIGEAVITALTVGAVVSVRPDLVYGARGLTRTLEIRTAAVAAPATPGASAPARPAAAADGTVPAPAGAASAATAASAASGVAARASERDQEAGAVPGGSAPGVGLGARADDVASAGSGADPDTPEAAGRAAASSTSVPAWPAAEAGDAVPAPAGAASVATAASAASGVSARVSERDEEAGAVPGGAVSEAADAGEAAGRGVGPGGEAGAPAAVGGTGGEAGSAATSGRAAAPVSAPGAPEVAVPATRVDGEVGASATGGDAGAVGGTASAAADAAAPAASGLAAARRSARRVWAVGVAAALVCAGVVSFYASASPDGLEKVAHDNGIDKKTEDHAAEDSPLADYGVKDITDARLSGGLAGVIGVGATLAVGSGLFVVVRRRAKKAAGPAAIPSAHDSETV